MPLSIGTENIERWEEVELAFEESRANLGNEKWSATTPGSFGHCVLGFGFRNSSCDESLTPNDWIDKVWAYSSIVRHAC